MQLSSTQEVDCSNAFVLKEGQGDLMTPCILDRYQAKGKLVYGYSSAAFDGDMSLGGNIYRANSKRQGYIDNLLRKFGHEDHSVSVNEGVYMLPCFGEPVRVYSKKEKQIVNGPEAVVFNEPLIVIMQPKDCPPIYYYDPDKNALGFCHGGYHSAERFCPSKTVSLMEAEFGTDPRGVVVFIGPGIGRGWFRRRYIVTSHPELWNEAVCTWDINQKVVSRAVTTKQGEQTILYPSANKVLDNIVKAKRSPLQFSTSVIDAIDFALSQLRTELPVLSVNLQKVLVGELISTGIQSNNIEVDTADTYQNSQRGLLFSHQGEYRRQAKVSGNPIAVFGKLDP